MSQTVLVIDDDFLIRSLLTDYLTHYNFNVIAVSNGPEGIKQYEAENPDLVVTDIAMPGMSGFEVAKSIREIQQHEGRLHTPIIVLTAYARSFFLSTGGEAYVDSFLTKPITSDQLITHVRRFLDTPSASLSEDA